MDLSKTWTYSIFLNAACLRMLLQTMEGVWGKAISFIGDKSKTTDQLVHKNKKKKELSRVLLGVWRNPKHSKTIPVNKLSMFKLDQSVEHFMPKNTEQSTGDYWYFFSGWSQKKRQSNKILLKPFLPQSGCVCPRLHPWNNFRGSTLPGK